MEENRKRKGENIDNEERKKTKTSSFFDCLPLELVVPILEFSIGEQKDKEIERAKTLQNLLHLAFSDVSIRAALSSPSVTKLIWKLIKQLRTIAFYGSCYSRYLNCDWIKRLYCSLHSKDLLFHFSHKKHCLGLLSQFDFTRYIENVHENRTNKIKYIQPTWKKKKGIEKIRDNFQNRICSLSTWIYFTRFKSIWEMKSQPKEWIIHEFASPDHLKFWRLVTWEVYIYNCYELLFDFLQMNQAATFVAMDMSFLRSRSETGKLTVTDASLVPCRSDFEILAYSSFRKMRTELIYSKHQRELLHTRHDVCTETLEDDAKQVLRFLKKIPVPDTILQKYESWISFDK